MDTATKRERAPDESAEEPSKRAPDSVFNDEDDSEDDMGDQREADRDSMASVSSFDDGFDSDMMGDDDDRETLGALPGLEREEMLAERHAARERGKELVQVRRRQLAQARQKREAERGPTKAKAKTATKRGARKPRRRLRREADSDSDGHDAAADEDDDDAESSDEELPEFAEQLKVREEAEDDSDYEGGGGGVGRGKGKRKGRPAPNGGRGRRWADEDDEELYGAAGARAFDDEDDDMGGYDSDGMPSARRVAVSDAVLARVAAEEGAERSQALTLDVINECRANRDFLAKSFHEPWFKDAVKGLPVRVHLGTSESGSERYRVCRIAEVVRHGKPYPLIVPDSGAGVASAASSRRTGSKVMTNRCLLVYVAHKDEGRPFPFSRVSNGPITMTELVEYLKHLQEQGREAPRPAWLRKRWSQTKSKSTQHSYTVAEVDAMLARQLKVFDASGVRNLAIAKAESQARLEASRVGLFEKLASLAIDKSTVKLPGTDAEMDAAVARAVGAMDEEGAKLAQAAVAEAAAAGSQLRRVIAAIAKEDDKRRAEAQQRDLAAKRNSSLNRKTEKRNLEMRSNALRKHREAEEKKEAMIRRVALSGGPKTQEEIEAALAKAREAAIDPIKRRDAVPAMIWKVKSEAQAIKDREEWLRKNAAGIQPGVETDSKANSPEKAKKDGNSSSSSASSSSSSSAAAAGAAADGAAQTAMAKLLGAGSAPQRSRKQLATSKPSGAQPKVLSGADAVLAAITAGARPKRADSVGSAAPAGSSSLSLTQLLQKRAKA